MFPGSQIPSRQRLRWHPPRRGLIYHTDDLERGLPGAPDVTDFHTPTPRKTIPPTLLGNKPSFLTVFLSTFSVIFVTFLDWGSPADSFAVSAHSLFSEGRFDKLFLSMMSHGDGAHLLSNLLGFVGFGYLLKRHFGTLAFPIMPALAGVVTTILTLMTMPTHTGLIGSSGIVFAMVGLYVSLYFSLETRHSAAHKLVRVSGFLLVLFFPSEYSQTTSYMAHGIGFGVGILSALVALPYVSASGGKSSGPQGRKKTSFRSFRFLQHGTDLERKLRRRHRPFTVARL